jgi:predicted dehydrogenase
MNKNITRRQFIQQTAAAASLVAAPTILPACATGRGRIPTPGSRINLGCIGVGNQGINDMRAFLRDERVQVTAVCDVNKGSDKGYWGGRPGGRKLAREIVEDHYGDQTRSGTFKGVTEYEDFREVLARDDIDAVLLAVPDHWHAIPVVEAAKAGKDIYGEKPLALTVKEGRIMSDAVQKHRRVFQTGSQQRSDQRFRFACELVRSGYIGELRTVKCGLPGGASDISKEGHRTAPETPPPGFNYDMWLGPAPDAPYRPACSHVNWRWVFDYSGGQVTDWGGHHPDIAQWGMGTEHTGPIAVQNAQVTYADHPVFDTAVQYYFECIYAGGVKLVVSSKERGGVTFEGSEGTVRVDRGRLDANPKSLLDVKLKDNDIKLYDSRNHQRNFVDCIYSREDPIAAIEIAHRSITIAHLGNIAMRTGRDLKWNPDKEQFIGDNDANQYLHRPYRGPWKLKGLPPGGKSLTV